MPLVGALHSTAVSRAPASAKAPPPLASIKVGRFEVIALTDGYADMPYGYFTGRAAGVIERSAEAILTARKTGLRLAFNQFLVRDGDQLILIDTGPAGVLGVTGQLPAALAALGVSAEDIDAVVLTHLHFDHISGLIAGGRNVFANDEVPPSSARPISAPVLVRESPPIFDSPAYRPRRSDSVRLREAAKVLRSSLRGETQTDLLQFESARH